MADKHHYKGLTDAQVFENRQKYGENSLSSVEGEPLWKQFLEKFTDPIIIILLVALVFSFGVSTYEYMVHNEGFDAFLEPIGILFAVLLATGVAFYFEHKANKQFEILNQVNDEIYYKVIRNEHITQVLKKDIVGGGRVVFGGAGRRRPRRWRAPRSRINAYQRVYSYRRTFGTQNHQSSRF